MSDFALRDVLAAQAGGWVWNLGAFSDNQVKGIKKKISKYLESIIAVWN